MVECWLKSKCLVCYIILGWKMERQAKTIHCTILPSHTLESAKQFVGELKSSCEAVKVNST